MSVELGNQFYPASLSCKAHSLFTDKILHTQIMCTLVHNIYNLVVSSNILTYPRVRYRNLVRLGVNSFQEERFFTVESEDL